MTEAEDYAESYRIATPEPRITEEELRPPGPSRSRLLAEVRRLRGLIVGPIATRAPKRPPRLSSDAEVRRRVKAEQALRTEAEAIRAEQDQNANAGRR